MKAQHKIQRLPLSPRDHTQSKQLLCAKRLGVRHWAVVPRWLRCTGSSSGQWPCLAHLEEIVGLGWVWWGKDVLTR